MENNQKKNKKFSQKGDKGGDTSAQAVNDKYAHIQPVQIKPLEVRVYGNNFERALKAFRALVQKEKILSLYKDKQSYEKPSQRKRRKRNETKRKALETFNKKD